MQQSLFDREREAYFSDPLVFTKSTLQLGALVFEQMAKVNRSLDAYEVRSLVVHGGDDGQTRSGVAHCLTYPLLTTADGKKMGKTESGAPLSVLPIFFPSAVVSRG